MITRMALKHFKCFSDMMFQLGRLTLLAGQNASGKSTVMQALGLLHQTMREQEWASRLMLNGETLNLGTASDVVDQLSSEHDCGIELIDGEDDLYQWTFKGYRTELSMAIQSAKSSIGGTEDWEYQPGEQLHYLLPISMESSSFVNRMKRLTYLSAERLAPQEMYKLHDPLYAQTVGVRGQLAVSLLSANRDQKVLEPLIVEDEPPMLLPQVMARMAVFFPGCELSVEEIKMANGLTLGIRSSTTTGYHRPSNTGFGITQLLPIVVAALAAREGDILLIENPEVHLHPAGQSLVGNFLAQVASAGVQVLVETHSDHVLNGILRAIMDKVLDGEGTSLYYFQERGQLKPNESQVIAPLVNDLAKLDHWPKGFFDQMEVDFGYLAWGEDVSPD